MAKDDIDGETNIEADPLLFLSDARCLLDIAHLVNAFIQSGGNLSNVAEELGLGRRTVYDLMEKYGITCCNDGMLSIQLTPLLRHMEMRVPRLESYLS